MSAHPATSGERSRDELVSFVRSYAGSDFYRKIWDGAAEFAALPAISRADFERAPASRRRYGQGKTFTKIVRTHSGMFASEWRVDDIAREEYGLLSRRPMVYLHDPHEALEKALWCYERGMIRLLGEQNHEIALFAARKFRIDSLITDSIMLPKLFPYLQERGELLEHLSIIGSAFDPASLSSTGACAKRVRLVLALPETGAFAEAPLAERLEFTPHPDCVIEHIDGNIVLTKLRKLVTPIIRYDTGIRAHAGFGRIILS